VGSLSSIRKVRPEESEAISHTEAVMNSLRQIVHALEIGSRAAQKAVGLSGAQLLILQILDAGGVMSINELARKSRTHQSSVSVVVSRLVQRGLVRRIAAAADARRLELSVTAAGRTVLEAGFVTPQQRLMASLGKMSPERVGELRVLLEEVVALSGIESGTPPMFFEETRADGKRRSR
jgi:DNA-binding MarR family transcriptional regulator